MEDAQKPTSELSLPDLKENRRILNSGLDQLVSVVREMTADGIARVSSVEITISPLRLWGRDGYNAQVKIGYAQERKVRDLTWVLVEGSQYNICAVSCP